MLIFVILFLRKNIDCCKSILTLPSVWCCVFGFADSVLTYLTSTILLFLSSASFLCLSLSLYYLQLFLRVYMRVCLPLMSQNTVTKSIESPFSRAKYSGFKLSRQITFRHLIISLIFFQSKKHLCL